MSPRVYIVVFLLCVCRVCLCSNVYWSWIVLFTGHYTFDACFEVNIRICQRENSDVHLLVGEAMLNITFEG